MKKYFLFIAFFGISFYALEIHAQQYIPDTEASIVKFVIKNVGMDTEGSFSGLEGNIRFNPADLKNALFEVSVQAGSIKTGIDIRDQNLLSTEYLDAQKYPLISFLSQSITATDKSGRYLMKGSFTIKGISKTISFPFQIIEKNEGLLFTGECRLKRTDFKIAPTSVVLSDSFLISLKVLAKKG